ncbi:nucleotidyltransferase [Serpentinicella alkaliphila]|uniref:tRNA(Met) cytidine acetate ligase n=1 Tax=Serpentinicella alkaliphila TaxID=1734049 RepID=A0A4R2TKJ2_9FIRM|nr:nucleotidyltransferase [Serpentinicella alkaliphila]QUH26243.1 nucleotidyltransferase [Serpentinicella alkaliphila]TCQ01705.1 putative nucleotidyltransferase [Serpentinicella alkaliphila]
MKILGLVTEYNPFHNGHLYHLNQSKEITGATHTIAVMSGNFLQRGEPALIHKWARAEMAVRCGVDLVIELPTIFACSTAELFALGSVSLLNELNAVNYICFGSESGNLKLLNDIAHIIVNSSKEYNEKIKYFLSEGMSFPVARSLSIIEYLKTSKTLNKEEIFELEQIIKSPNNILAIEYLKALIKRNSPITPYTITRIKAGYHSLSLEESIASATAIREHINKYNSLDKIESVMPDASFRMLHDLFKEQIGPISTMDMSQSIMTILRREDPTNLKRFFDVTEGLENKLHTSSLQTESLEELYSSVKSKRYTTTRIQRICMHILLNLTKDMVEKYGQKPPPYARILAFNNKGRDILRLCNKQSNIPLINKVSLFKPETLMQEELLKLDIRATNIYSLFMKNKKLRNQQLDYLINPKYIN